MGGHKTARYQIIPDGGGNRFRFFCELSGAVLCTTEPIRSSSAEEELRIAWEIEGRSHFNRCEKCGRWVSDVMYNADVLQCVDCAPWEDTPRYCPTCGARLKEGDPCCPDCGKVVTGGDSNVQR